MGAADKGEGVAAGVEGVTLVDDIQTAAQVEIKELLDHSSNLFVADDRHFRIMENQLAQCCSVVHFHMLNDNIVQLAAAQNMSQIFQMLGCRLVYGIKDNGFFIQQDIGVIRNTHGNLIDTLKQCQTAVIRTYSIQVIGYITDTIHYVPHPFPMVSILLYFAVEPSSPTESHSNTCIIS